MQKAKLNKKRLGRLTQFSQVLDLFSKQLRGAESKFTSVASPDPDYRKKADAEGFESFFGGQPTVVAACKKWLYKKNLCELSAEAAIHCHRKDGDELQLLV